MPQPDGLDGVVVSPGQVKQAEWFTEQLQTMMTSTGLDQRPEHCKVIKSPINTPTDDEEAQVLERMIYLANCL